MWKALLGIPVTDFLSFLLISSQMFLGPFCLLLWNSISTPNPLPPCSSSLTIFFVHSIYHHLPHYIFSIYLSLFTLEHTFILFFCHIPNIWDGTWRGVYPINICWINEWVATSLFICFMLSLESYCKHKLALSWQHFKNVYLSLYTYSHSLVFKEKP